MTNPTLERAARAVEKCRIEVRDKRNLELQNMGLWPDHAAQPSNEEIARAVLMAVREPDEEFMLALYPDPDSISADRGRAAGERSRRAGRMQIDHFVRAILAEGE